MTSCPNCGAPAQGSRCAYCNTPLESWWRRAFQAFLAWLFPPSTSPKELASPREAAPVEMKERLTLHMSTEKGILRNKTLRGDMNTYHELVDCEVVGNMNTIRKATRCRVRGNMNTIKYSIDTKVDGSMNTVKRRE